MPAAQQRMAAQGRAAGSAQQPEEEDEEGLGVNKFAMYQVLPACLTSMVVHAVALIVLALLAIPAPPASEETVEISSPDEEPETEKVEELVEPEIKPVETVQSFEDSPPSEVLSAEVPETPVPSEDLTPPTPDIQVAALKTDPLADGLEAVPQMDFGTKTGSIHGKGLEGRGSSGVKKGLLKKYGGNAASEAAVARALEWFARHQLRDGGWDFEHSKGIPGCNCSGPGKGNARNGATAMALLPFLGAGQTHLEGNYKKNVLAGAAYLVGKQNKQTGSLFEPGGNMYSHGLAAIALTELYGMTNDRRFLAPAQGSLAFIAQAQDPVGGGWRYQPKQKGDTSVVGWQVMALKSGHMAYLKVPPGVVAKASKFLDSVSVESGTYYGYASPGKKKSTTAIGLLCRMHLGWKKQEPALERGVEYLSQQGVSKGNNADMYYNYSATHVVRHYEGDYWKKWNDQMRDWLVNSQEKNGHQSGSWLMRGGHANNAGGRLYCTSMATMMLEVYYRHMPIYGSRAVTDDFPLD